MGWLQISINTTKGNVELAEDVLFATGALTVTLTDAADQPILEPGVDETPVWNEVTVTGLFNPSDNPAELLLAEIKSGMDTIDYSARAEVLEEQNWTRAWMEHYQAMQFGERLWVCPLHIDPPDPDAVNLRLDPGLAFGTGTHPTTALCLRWLDANIHGDDRSQQTLLDYGCGSGILAIAASMLGIGQVDAVDIDPQALTATLSNAKTNQVSEKISTFLPDDFQKHAADPPLQYEIVVANILSGPLAELAPTLARHTRSGGDIILSGILKEQAETVQDTYGEYFAMDTPVFEEDWVLLHGTKK